MSIGNLNWFTAGESHGQAIMAFFSGLPSGLKISLEEIESDLRRRQKGYGRGKRMEIEQDCAEILSGLRGSVTLGSPIVIKIENRDWQNWQKEMHPFEEPEGEPVVRPRPGHADLAGLQKFGFTDVRNVLERASARETAARVAVGSLARQFLANFGVRIVSQVISIGSVDSGQRITSLKDAEAIEDSPVRCLDKKAEKEMMLLIDQAREKGDTLGGVFEVVAFGVVPGLGSYTTWEERLDAQLAFYFLSIPSVKGFSLGEAFENSRKFGSLVHDEIFYDENQGFYHQTNNAGGIEGGVSNGEEIRVKIAVKPIPTLMNPLRTVDVITKEAVRAHQERADVCAVPAAAVVGEAMMALVLTQFYRQKFGGDSISDALQAFEKYLSRINWRR